MRLLRKDDVAVLQNQNNAAKKSNKKPKSPKANQKQEKFDFENLQQHTTDSALARYFFDEKKHETQQYYC